MADQPKKIESANKTYEILKPLGEGGTSVVYLANDGKHDVALKILGEEVDPAFKDKYVQILKNEFEVLSKLRHPNIAQVFDFEFSKELGKYFFTTEFVDGYDIYNYTAKSDFKIKEELFVQLLIALDYVHRNGLIHCDVKCGNALVTIVGNKPMLKLVDFGFATRTLSTTGSVVGTANYLAPELLTRSSDVDHRIDIYAAGILFYRLLHRAYPYKSPDVNQIIKWHKEHKDITFADDTPEYIKHLITRMTLRYPSDRIQTCVKAVEFINARTEGRYKAAAENIVGQQLKEGPFVGRAKLLEKAVLLLKDLKAKKSPAQQGFVVAGPQGIGKSRLFREIKYRSELEEIPIKEYSCVEGHDHVLEFTNSFKEIPKPKGLEDSKSGDVQKLAQIEWINSLLAYYKDKGLIIVIDDIQLSSSAFIKFFDLLDERLNVRRTEHSLPIVTLIGSRPRSELVDMIGAWFDKTKLEKIELDPLDKGDIKKYISEIGLKDKHDKNILEFSGGVPGLVEAYCQHIMSPGGVARPPTSLAQSYLDRTKNLPEDSKICLKFISVARRELNSDDLSVLTGLDRENTQAAIQNIISLGLATMVYPSMDVRVLNKALSQTIKTNLSPADLSSISSKLGEWLDQKEPNAISEIADYYYESGNREETLKYSKAAAEFFEMRFNNSEAAKYYDIAVANADDEDLKKKMTRAVSRMDVVMGRYKDALSKLRGLIDSGDKHIENFRLLGMAHTKMRDYPTAKKWYQDGLALMTDETAITDIVQFKNSLGNVSFYSGDLENSEKYFTEAIADATVCLLLNNNLGLIHNAKGSYDQAVKFYESRKSYLAAKQDKRALSLCCAEFGYVHMTNNNFKAAVEQLEESYKLAYEISDWYNILIILGNLIRCYQQLAQYSNALDLALKSLELEANLGSIEEIAQNHLTIGILYETVGVLDLSKQHIEMALDRFKATGNQQMVGWCHLTKSYIHKDLDNFKEAAAELNAAEKITAKGEMPDLETWIKYSLADLFVEYGRTKDAKNTLGKITHTPPGEFELRIRLLKLKLGEFASKDPSNEFISYVAECNDYPELRWEANAAFAKYLESNDKNEEAFRAYIQAAEIIESIAEKISDAYKDSYKSQRFRYEILKKAKPKSYSKPTKKDTATPQDTEEEDTSEID